MIKKREVMKEFDNFIKNRPQELCLKCAKCCREIVKCEHIDENNLCKIYDNRAEFCKNFPASPWEEVPQGCGYEGWLFKKREEKKQYIRKLKEKILSYEIIIKETSDAEKVERIVKIIQKTERIIKRYSKYGSENW